MFDVKERWVGGFLYSTDPSRLDVAYVHEFLSKESYWAAGVPLEVVQRALRHSLCFGIYEGQEQVGFARLVTDYATFGYLADVFVDPRYRRRGLAKQLMDFIFEHEELKRFRRLLLGTRDAHALYTRSGFAPLANPSWFLELHRPHVYGSVETRAQPEPTEDNPVRASERSAAERHSG